MRPRATLSPSPENDMKTTTTTTAAPQVKGHNFLFVPVSTEEKTTQSDTVTRYSAARNFALVFRDGNKKDFQVGDWVDGFRIEKENFSMLDAYNYDRISGYEIDGEFFETRLVPMDFLKKRFFSVVREYRVTEWEIVPR